MEPANKWRLKMTTPETIKKRIDNANNSDLWTSETVVDRDTKIGHILVKGISKAVAYIDGKKCPVQTSLIVSDVLDHPRHWAGDAARQAKNAGYDVIYQIVLGGNRKNVWVGGKRTRAAMAAENKASAELRAAYKALNAAIRDWDNKHNDGCDGYNPFDPYR